MVRILAMKHQFFELCIMMEVENSRPQKLCINYPSHNVLSLHSSFFTTIPSPLSPVYAESESRAKPAKPGSPARTVAEPVQVYMQVVSSVVVACSYYFLQFFHYIFLLTLKTWKDNRIKTNQCYRKKCTGRWEHRWQKTAGRWPAHRMLHT